MSVGNYTMARSGGTLLEVARRCSVSQSTVSRVLNNSKHGRFSVSPQVREKILRVARELNYRPSVAARNLTASKTRLVAVLGVKSLLSDVVGPMERATVELSRVLDAAGYEICMQFLSRRHNPFDLPPLRVDGVVAVGATGLDELQTLEDSGIPYVSIDGVVGRNGALVAPDDAGGTRLALRHLVELGHRRIAYLDNPTIDARHPSVLERRDAFTKARAELGFEVPAIDLAPLPPDTPWDLYYEPFLKRAIIAGRATAVLCYSHFGAMSLLRVAHELGLSVPRDFSLACFNDEPMIRLSVPSITAVDVPAAELGKRAAELLLGRMSQQSSDPLPRIRLEESLVVRESTAPPGRSTK
ncbi:LacI family DNA-binding transcriptional regulator [Fontivita pretiosa]|uniref:LacI family DNA-binding transcriptional regulator n=1 Tax=Fontivita pretiosa TaxID=2989684 RepID=UPI003D185848